jgi:mRNA interferase HicA
LSFTIGQFCPILLFIGSKEGEMNSDQLERELRKQGIRVENLGSTGHRRLINPANGKQSILPKHGGRKQLGTGLVNRIYKDLGLR